MNCGRELRVGHRKQIVVTAAWQRSKRSFNVFAKCSKLQKLIRMQNFFWTFYQFRLLGLEEKACFTDSLEWMGFKYKNKMKRREKKK